jgi:hypothetical protein
MTEPLTARTAAIAVARGICFRSTLALNYTPPDWWECDLFEISKAGFATEYEVKLSRGDFNRDALKQQTRFSFDESLPGLEGVQRSTLNKHDLLAAGDTRGPARFYFVTPYGLIERVPAWAGWGEVVRDRGGVLRWHVRKPAPRLHSAKVSDQTRTRVFRACHWRMWRLLVRGESAATGGRP